VGFLIWIEGTGLAEWVRSSIPGYPSMIACHAIGMAVMVGLALALDLRLLGWFQGIPYAALNRFLGIAWAGFLLNTISGTALFAAYATTYVTDFTFLLKMALVVLGAITAAVLQNAVARDSAGWGITAPGGVRGIAAISIAFWFFALVTGRLIAYL
jgi:hypothetical protein